MKKGKELLLGGIFILAIILLYGGISFLKGHSIFSSNNTYYVCYHDVTGLSKSSPIYVNGVRIGIVKDINCDYNHPENIVVCVGINKKLRIPKKSNALLDTELLGTVNVILDLAPDEGDYYAPGDTLAGFTDTGIRSQLAQMMPQFAQLVPKVDSILTNVNLVMQDPSIPQAIHNAETLTSEARDVLSELSSTMHRVSTLVGTYQGVGEKLDTLTERLNTLSDNQRVEALLSNLETTVKNIQDLSNKLTTGDGTAHKIITDPTLYDHLNNVCTEASALIEDIKKNPSRYIRIFGRSKE